MNEQRVRKPGLAAVGAYDYDRDPQVAGRQAVLRRMRELGVLVWDQTISSVRNDRFHGDWTDRAIRSGQIIRSLATDDPEGKKTLEEILDRKRSVYGVIAQTLVDLRKDSEGNNDSRSSLKGYPSAIQKALGLDHHTFGHLTCAMKADLASAYLAGEDSNLEQAADHFILEFRTRYETPARLRPKYFNEWLAAFDEEHENAERRLGIVGILRFNQARRVHCEILVPLLADVFDRFYQYYDALSPFDTAVLKLNRSRQDMAGHTRKLQTRYGVPMGTEVIPTHFHVLTGDYALPRSTT